MGNSLTSSFILPDSASILLSQEPFLKPLIGLNNLAECTSVLYILTPHVIDYGRVSLSRLEAP